MYAKIISSILWMIFFSFFLSGCIKQHGSNQGGYEVNVSLDEMMCYPEYFRDSTFKPKYKYVVYVDSSECSPCKVAHMGIWNYFRNNLLDYNSDIYIILFAKKDKVQAIIETYASYKHRIPIYIDSLGVFKRNNPQIAEMTTEYHSFLLDENNKIVGFGDASTNHYVRDEIFRILSENADSTITERHP